MGAKAPRAPKVEFYEDKAAYHRWRLKAANGKIVADSGEGYSSLRKARAGLEAARKAMACLESAG